MTREELEEVRELKREMRREEGRLTTLRLSMETLTQLMDGMPHARSQSSKVERLTLQIIETERLIGELRARLLEAATKILDAIKNAPLTQNEQQLLILRYVQCLNFKDIWERLEYSDAHVYRLHAEALEKMRVR